MLDDSTKRLIERVRSGERAALARAITLVESTRPEHAALAGTLLDALLPSTGHSLRLAISGTPGAGKSTFIEKLGLHIIGLGKKPAVLAIDPSSTVSGGSILGDKTRMEQLSLHDSAYIRPSPSSGLIGGVTSRTREAILLCEAAGFDVIIVETVGTGQSETSAANMTDLFVLLQLPGAGDDLQAMKKGALEIADIIVINKCDVDAQAAERAFRQIASNISLNASQDPALRSETALHPGDFGVRQVFKTSALTGAGISDFWSAATRLHQAQRSSGELGAKRGLQSLRWMWDRLEGDLLRELRQHAALQHALPTIGTQVQLGTLSAPGAAQQLLALFRS